MEAGQRVAVLIRDTGTLHIGTIEGDWPDVRGEETMLVRFGQNDVIPIHVRNMTEISRDYSYNRALAGAWAGLNVNDDLGHRLLGTERVSGVDVSVYVKDGQLYLAGNGGANLRRVSGA